MATRLFRVIDQAMSWQYIWQLAKSDYWKLLPLLGLAFYIAFIPHQNYPYPVHVDEWVHLAYSKAMLGAGSTTFTEPFYGESTIGLSSNLEAGFHLFWGVFQGISGISWLTIFRYFPSFIFMITVLSVYVMGRRDGFGWEAALFTCLILTTVGILGPAFMVPVAMGLLFIPQSLFLAFNFRTWWSYLVLFIFTCFLLSIHAPTAVGLVMILIPYILLNLKGNFKHSLGIILAIAIPFLAVFPWIFDMLLPTAKLLLIPQPLPTYIDFPRIIQTYGYIPIGFSLLGTFLLAIRGGKKNYSLILGLLALLVMLVTFFTFHYGLHIMYTRGLMYMMLMMGIIAGVGLMGVRTTSLPTELIAEAGLRAVRIIRLPSKFITGPKSFLSGNVGNFLAKNVGNIVCLVLIGVILAVYIPDRQDTLYYHMIDEEDYQAFVWIRDNINEDYEKAILDPWKATAFTAITQKNIYTRIHSYPYAIDTKAYEFLRGGSTDTTFLRENEISIVYSQWSCDNPDLTEVRKNVYLLEEAGIE